MRKRLLTTMLLVAAMFAVTSSALAQALRPERTFYLTPHIGITKYIGDNDTTPLDFNDWGEEELPIMGALEFGYQFTTRYSLAGYYAIGNYPSILPPNNPNDVARHTAGLLFRWTAMAGTARVAPYLEVGFNATTRGSELGMGPSAGIGLDVALNDRMSLTFGWLTHVTTPDEAVDYVASEAFSDDIDLLNWLNLGLKFNFKSAFTPVEVLALECPTNVTAGEAVTFTATTTAAEATPPVTFAWDFGDGARGDGEMATHTFTQAGTYTVTFTASNNGEPAVRTCVVNVAPMPEPAVVVSATANPMRFDVCEDRTVTFTANARGDEPVTYTWDFGDGATATGAAATHVYSEEGTYTVTLTVSNPAGTDTRTLTITAEPCRVGICYEVTEMNSVFFNRNSSVLTDEGGAALQENVEILRECPNLCARIEGFAAPGERNPQELSEARARAVQQFYSDNGIAASRLTVAGQGAVGGTTSKKEGTSQYRRVDTIPMQCEDMR